MSERLGSVASLREAQSATAGTAAWRPSADPAKDILPHLDPLKDQHLQALQFESLSKTSQPKM